MKETTFEELIDEVSDKNNYATRLWRQQLTPNTDVLKLLQQVREATIAEIENKANEYGEYGTADYAHELPTERIKLTDK